MSLPNCDKLTMRAKALKTRDLILSLSKDEAKISCFFNSLLVFVVALSLQVLHALGTGEEHLVGYIEEKPMHHDSRDDIEVFRQAFHIGDYAEGAIGDQMTAIGAV